MVMNLNASLLAFALAVCAAASPSSKLVVIPHTDPLIHYHGRWDASPGTWWTGSGFKLHTAGLSSLTFNLGPNTTAPLASIGVSVDYAPFVTVNVSQGANALPASLFSDKGKKGASLVRINSEGWQNNRVNLASIEMNSDATLLPYTPQKLAFQFIGDSLSAGQYLPQGVDKAWPFLTGENFRAEHNVNAQPGVTLSDIISYGNQRGMSYLYFRTEDDGYFYTADHNYTTPWNFARDVPQATHVVIHIGANDASQNVTQTNFIDIYSNFIERLRTIYAHHPIFVFTPWGWPAADGSVSYYYPGAYQTIVDARHASGDSNVFLVNTTGWVTWADVYPDNQHPNVAGHQKIAKLFGAWLEDWGLKPERTWATPA